MRGLQDSRGLLAAKTREGQLSPSGQMEIYFYGDLNRNGCAVFHRGRKFPLLYGVDGCVIEIGVQGSRDFDIARHTIGTNNQLQFNRTFATYVLL